MIAKIGRGKSIRGLLAYALRGSRDRAYDKGGVIVGGTVAGSDYDSLSREFAAARALRPDVQRPAWHCSLSLAPGEHLDDARWSALVRDYMHGMGYSDTALYVAVRHNDTDHEHVHIVASRVQLDGTLYKGAREALRSMPITNQLAAQYGLSAVAHDQRAQRAGISTGERGRAERTGETPARLRLQVIIDSATRDKPSLETLINRLSGHKVTIIPSGKTGAPQGLSYSIDGIIFSGSKLGNKYKLAQIKKLIDYDIERDQYLIDKLRKNSDKTINISRVDTTDKTKNEQKQQVTRSRTLDLAFEKSNDDGVYRWKNNGRAAFVDTGNIIRSYSQSDTAIRGIVQLAKQKGWSAINCDSDDIDAQRRLYLIAGEMGITVASYTPTDNDKKQLQHIIDNKRSKYGRQIRNSETASEQRVSTTTNDNRTINNNKLDTRQSESNIKQLDDNIKYYKQFIDETRETIKSNKPKDANNNSISVRDSELIDKLDSELLSITTNSRNNTDKQLDNLRHDIKDKSSPSSTTAAKQASEAQVTSDDDDDDSARMR